MDRERVKNLNLEDLVRNLVATTATTKRENVQFLIWSPKELQARTGSLLFR